MQYFIWEIFVQTAVGLPPEQERSAKMGLVLA